MSGDGHKPTHDLTMSDVGDVVSLAAARARHAGVEPEHRAPMHPALRWVAGAAYWVAHRRSTAGGAACGAAGPLVLAPPGVPLCRHCYPAIADPA